MRRVLGATRTRARKPRSRQAEATGSQIRTVDRALLICHVERLELAAAVKIRMILRRTASLTVQALRVRAGDDGAEGVEIRLQVPRDAVVEAEVIVVDEPVVHQRDAESNRLSLLPLEKKA